MLGVVVFIVGACVGSFLNVCIYRLEKGASIIRPRSYCPDCKHPLAWYDNIPLLSYLILMGRCRYCRRPISFRYFTVEWLTAAIFLLFLHYFGLTVPFFIFISLASALIVASFIDLKARIIPDEISLPGIGIALLVSFIYPALQGTGSHLRALLYSFLGLIVGGGAIYLTGLLGDFIFKKESMGGGDVKLLAMIGAFIGWKLALLTFFIAPLFGAVVGIILKIKNKTDTIPYGPFISLAAIIAIIWGEEIIRRILY